MSKKKQQIPLLTSLVTESVCDECDELVSNSKWCKYLTFLVAKFCGILYKNSKKLDKYDLVHNLSHQNTFLFQNIALDCIIHDQSLQYSILNNQKSLESIDKLCKSQYETVSYKAKR